MMRNWFLKPDQRPDGAELRRVDGVRLGLVLVEEVEVEVEGYLCVPRRRGLSREAMMSAMGGAVEEVQELWGRGGVGVGGGRRDL